MDDHDSAGDVLSRAEVAIRRARGLTRLYSDLLEPPCTAEAAAEPETLALSLPRQEGLSHLPPQQHAVPVLAHDVSVRRSEQHSVEGESGHGSPEGQASPRSGTVPDRPYLRYFQTGGTGLPAMGEGFPQTIGQPRAGNRDTFSYYLGLIRERNRLVSQRQNLLQGRRSEASGSDLTGEASPSVSGAPQGQCQAGPSSAAATPNDQLEQASPHTGEGSDVAVPAEVVSTEDLIAHCPGAEPVLVVAQRLATLQQQQAETMRQLLRLRLEQLRLRQQQLSALQCLLRTEAACIEGNPLQLSAVQQAVDLLADSLEDVHTVASTLQWDGEVSQVAAVAQNVSEADARAEEVSMMARQLLAALRMHPMRSNDSQPAEQVLRGATATEIANHPIVVCTADSVAFGDPCSICLATFNAGDNLRGLQCDPPNCTHYFHQACIDEWLAIKGCCPLCKFEIAT